MLKQMASHNLEFLKYEITKSEHPKQINYIQKEKLLI